MSIYNDKEEYDTTIRSLFYTECQNLCILLSIPQKLLI